MSEEEETETATEPEQIAQEEQEQEQQQEPIVDIEETGDLDSEEELREQIEKQQQQIEELQSQLLDLSTRVAHGGGIGVCPIDGCNGPVVKVRRWVRPNTIECRRCGEQFHKY